MKYKFQYYLFIIFLSTGLTWHYWLQPLHKEVIRLQALKKHLQQRLTKVSLPPLAEHSQAVFGQRERATFWQANVLLAMMQLIKNEHIKLNTFTILKTSSFKRVPLLHLKISFLGAPASLVHFLQSLIYFSYPLLIEKLSLLAISKQKLKLKLRLKIFAWRRYVVNENLVKIPLRAVSIFCPQPLEPYQLPLLSLANLPLNLLQAVGTLQQNYISYAIIKLPDGRLQSVASGNKLSKEGWRIKAINTQGIHLVKGLKNEHTDLSWADSIRED